MTDREDSVDIVLAAYNGAPFLDRQILSVLNQSFTRFRLIVRDDHSTDGTDAVLRQYAARDDRIVRLADDSSSHLGSCGSFGRLMQETRADYVMLCDQDDVWLPDKIALTLQCVKRLEQARGPDHPILVHTDLVVTDATLKPVHHSFGAYEGIDPAIGGTFNRLLVQNVVAGCTSMANRALLRKAMPIPPEAVVHDWWLALTAAALGTLEYLPQATVLYRQHGNNRIGAHGWDFKQAVRKGLSFFRREGFVDRLRDTQHQARVFGDRFGPELPAGPRAAVEAYAGLGQCGFFRRRATLVRYGFYKHGWLRNAALFAGI